MSEESNKSYLRQLVREDVHQKKIEAARDNEEYQKSLTNAVEEIKDLVHQNAEAIATQIALFGGHLLVLKDKNLCGVRAPDVFIKTNAPPQAVQKQEQQQEEQNTEGEQVH